VRESLIGQAGNLNPFRFAPRLYCIRPTGGTDHRADSIDLAVNDSLLAIRRDRD
jgi:hypothetical protein